MSLSGNLGFVPIDEVLRLLTRSHQQGSVDVTGNGVRGRVFVGKGGIDLATTFDDEELHRHLINSRYADEKALNRITSGETTLAAIAESNTALIDLLREMTVESLYQIADRGEDFEVQERVSTPYASPKSFDLEALLTDADERRKEWDKVSEVVPDLTGAIAFRRDLGGREEVTVRVDDWKVLSEIGTGSSVRRIAEHLGTTDFWTARVAARLVKNDLVVISGEQAPPVEDHEDDDRFEEAGITYEEHEVAPPSDAYAEYEAEKSATQDTDVAEDSDYGNPEPEVAEDSEAGHDESWWQEPQDEVTDSDDRDEQTPEVVSEGLSEIPSVGEGDDEDGEEDVEEDTEAFLEKVFSELESSEADSAEEEDSDSSESETEEGHGLLRRRRMGTLRDFSSDS